MHYLYGNSDRCQPCVRCMEGVRNSEGPLWEVPLYTMHMYLATCLHNSILVLRRSLTFSVVHFSMNIGVVVLSRMTLSGPCPFNVIA